MIFPYLVEFPYFKRSFVVSLKGILKQPRPKSPDYQGDAVVKIKGQGLADKKNVSVKDLLDAGVQFGHQTQRWNPKMKPYIFEARNGIHIIDLAKTRKTLLNVFPMIEETIENGGSILFVGTKKQAKEIVKQSAEASDEYFVSERWPGGMLTNHKTMRLSMKKLDNVEKRISQEGDLLPKVERIRLQKLQEKLDRVYSGVRQMKKLPKLVVVVDADKEHIAVKEANKLGIPVIGLVDTNSNPDPISHVIPCNDDASKSIRVILEAIAQAIIDKKNAMGVVKAKEGEAEEAPKAMASTGEKIEETQGANDDN